MLIDIVTAERPIYSGEVDVVTAPGSGGYFSILPHHTPFMTMLGRGKLVIRKGSENIYVELNGGFLEYSHNRVTVLADAAEREDKTRAIRAESAKLHAQEHMRQAASPGKSP